ILAQIDAIAEAGATAGSLLHAWGERRDDAWMTWAICFGMGCLAGSGSMRAALSLVETLPDDAPATALLAAGAVLIAPDPNVAALARDLVSSASPLALVVGIELSSRRFALDAEMRNRSLEHASPEVRAAALRAIAREAVIEDALLPRVIACLRDG